MKSIFKIITSFIGMLMVTACQVQHDYVDLGLPSGTLWATYNVGAATPTEAGDFFAWGETEPKESFEWTSYKWGNEESLEKYCTESEYGKVDSLTVLSDADDAATVNWGSDWRMPLTTEMQELVNSCKWEHTDNYQGSGVSGMIGTSLYNKEKIFFPITDILEIYYGNGSKRYYSHIPKDTKLDNNHRKIPGSYFSKNLKWSNSANCIEFDCSMAKDWTIRHSWQIRIKGSNIRAVRTEKIANEKKNVPSIFKDANGLEIDSVAGFRVKTNYKKQSLTISGFFNHTTDWTNATIDTLVSDSILYVMVKGVDTKKKSAKGPHKSAYFEKEFKISPGIKKVVFGPSIKTIWKRHIYEATANENPMAELVEVIESSELQVNYISESFKIKEADKIMSMRCSDTSEFASLMPKGYVYNGIFSSCDVNKDGKTDYLLAIEGPYEEGEYPKEEPKKSSEGDDESEEEYHPSEGPQHAYQGIMLAISEGDTSYVSDVWNSGCLYPVDEDGGGYIPPGLTVSAKDDKLKISYGFGRYGFWSYSFVYKDGNYQLTKALRGQGGDTDWHRITDLENGIYEEELLKGNGSKLYKTDEDEYEVYKFKIKRAFKYTLTNMETFTL